MMIDLRNGDCLEIMRDLPDGSIDMVLTDPPYGTTQCKWDSIIAFQPMWEQLERVTKNNGVIALMAQSPFDKVLGASNIKKLKYEWIWQKEAGTGHLNAKKAPLKNHENILIFYRKQPTYNPQMRIGFKPYTQSQGKTKSKNYGKQTGAITVSNGERYPLSTITFARDKDKIHPTQKPIALMEYLIKTYTSEGETVLDFTMGSGTTGVACININRKFIGIEIDKQYFDIASQRISNAISREGP